jgi:hypothetical protein
MIVNVEGLRHIGVPVVIDADGKPIVSKVVDLCPGYSEVDDVLWSKARVHALEKIEKGIIKEEWVKVVREDAKKAVLMLDSEDTKETTKCRIPAKISDITRTGKKINEVVKGTFHIPTLEKWFGEELRADVRIELQEQIRLVNSGELKG